MFQLEDKIVASMLIQPSNINLIRQFASLFKIHFFLENEVIVKQNDIGDNFYLICEGIVEVALEYRDYQFFNYFLKQELMEKEQMVFESKKNESATGFKRHS